MQFALQYSVLYDAFICIVPRICIALVVWALYRRLPCGTALRTGIAAVAGSLTNTILFLGSFFLLVGAPYHGPTRGISVEAVGAMILGIVGMNGVPEALVSGIIVVPIVMTLKKSGWKLK